MKSIALIGILLAGGLAYALPQDDSLQGYPAAVQENYSEFYDRNPGCRKPRAEVQQWLDQNRDTIRATYPLGENQAPYFFQHPFIQVVSGPHETSANGRPPYPWSYPYYGVIVWDRAHENCKLEFYIDCTTGKIVPPVFGWTLDSNDCVDTSG